MRYKIIERNGIGCKYKPPALNLLALTDSTIFMMKEGTCKLPVVALVALATVAEIVTEIKWYVNYHILLC